MVILMAALLDVPRELYEAAAIDGAGSVARFRFVTLPAIRPVLLFAAITGIIETLQYFTQATVAAKVAPGRHRPARSRRRRPAIPAGSTLTYPQLIVDQGFTQFNMGYASALAVLLFVVSLVFTVGLLRGARSLTEEPA